MIKSKQLALFGLLSQIDSLAKQHEVAKYHETSRHHLGFILDISRLHSFRDKNLSTSGVGGS